MALISEIKNTMILRTSEIGIPISSISAATSGSCYRGRIDVTAGDPDEGAVEREVLAVAGLLIKVNLMKAAARGRDRPQLALETVDLAGVVGKHPARGALLDGLLYAFSSSGVPGIG